MKKIIVAALIALIVITGCNNGEEPSLGTVRISVPNDVTDFNVPLGTTLVAVYTGPEKGNETYQWNKSGTAISGKTATSFTPDEPGMYNVTVSAKGYQSITSNTVTVVGDGITFVDDPDNVGREFTVFEDLGFMVELFDPFLDPFDDEDKESFLSLGLVPGLIVSGKVIDTNDTWTSNIITGYAYEMRSNIEDLPPAVTENVLVDLNDVLSDLDPILTKMSYGFDENGVINSINVEFPGGGEWDPVAATLLGGEYVRKK